MLLYKKITYLGMNMIVITADIDQFMIVNQIISRNRYYESKNNYMRGEKITYIFEKRLAEGVITTKEIFNMYWVNHIDLSALIVSHNFPKRIFNMREVRVLLASSCNIIDLSYLKYLPNLKILIIHQSSHFDYTSAKDIKISYFIGCIKDRIELEKVLGRDLKLL